ncbi:retinol dehydrogenase [Halenospora varia]|nr:retinol dehydrogenase [Halenospora varia]
MTTHAEFHAQTTGETVASAFSPGIRGKTILITGVSPSSLGTQLAHTLAAHSPKLLILTGRTPAKVQLVIDSLTSTYPHVQTQILQLDVSSFSSVRTAAAEVGRYEEKIDILINNAGIMNLPERQLSVDGYELQLATNYLGLFLFTNLLLSQKSLSPQARTVNVGTTGYAFSPFRFSDYNFTPGKEVEESELPPKEIFEGFGMEWGRGYLPVVGYAQSKSAVMLYTRGLAKRGFGAICVHPGSIETGIWRNMEKEAVEGLLQVLPMKTISQGISTILVGALDPKLAEFSGIYMEDCQPKEVLEFARDDEKAEKLWKLTEEIVGQTFDF